MAQPSLDAAYLHALRSGQGERDSIQLGIAGQPAAMNVLA
jgi:hypothetical protein